MRAVVIYESMYGNTRAVAEAIAEGLRGAGADVPAEVAVSAAAEADGVLSPERPADLVVVGAPTHVRGLPRPATRRSAAQALAKRGDGLHLEEHATEAGVREWLTRARLEGTAAAAFDTHYATPLGFGGSAAKRIAAGLRRAGARLVDRPTGFRVRKGDTLEDGELARATQWGSQLAGEVPRQQSGRTRSRA